MRKAIVIAVCVLLACSAMAGMVEESMLVMTRRPSAAEATFSPDSIPNMTHWWDASVTTNMALSGERVLTWHSRVNGVVATNSANNPYLKASVRNGLSAIAFTNTTWLKFFDAPASTTNMTAVMVAHRKGTGSAYFPLGQNGQARPHPFWIFSSDSKAYVYMVANRYTGPTYSGETNLCAVTRYSGTNPPPTRVNGSTISLGSESPGSYPSSLNVIGGGYEPHNGYIYEIMIFSRYLTDSEVSQIESYVQTKWSIP